MDSYVDLLNLNFMYSLRTGNLLTDMMIAALLPLVSGAIAYLTRTWWPQLVSRILFYFSTVYSTSATFKTSEQGTGLYYGNTLRVALSLYVTNVLKPRFDVAELKYLSIPGKSLQEATSYTEAMRDYCFVDAGPAKELPMRLTKDLELQQNDPGENKMAEGNKSKHSRSGTDKSKRSQESLFTITQKARSFPSLFREIFTLRRNGKNSNVSEAVAQLEHDAGVNGDLIQSLLDRSVEHYRLQYKEAAKKTERYLYQPLLMPLKPTLGAVDEKDSNRGAMKCNFYPLRSEKTFQSLFFPDKQRLIKLIDDFEQKTGKYAIPGYPQKLVLLLYGPPGTGKTSLAKAVATYTKRHLFAVSLSRIRNNEELLKYMFSDRVKVKKDKASTLLEYGQRKEDTVEVLDPAKLVYILEDVDATTAVVLKDESKENQSAEGAQKQRNTCKAEVTSTQPAPTNGSDDDAKEDQASGNTPKERSGTTEDKSTDDNDDTSHETSMSPFTAPEKNSTERALVKVKEKSEVNRRSLTIEGLTNALSGVLDFPQRIVIMTTNHIEKLHPSLLRPGVVTMKLHMHNFDAECAVEMVKHYFSHTTLLPSQLEALRSVVEAASLNTSKVDTTTLTTEEGVDISAQETKGFSPAELEQRCAECDTIDELLVTLRQGSRVNIF